MNEQRQNEAIAKVCGWTQKEVLESSFQNPLRNVSRGLAWHDPRGIQHRRLPDYLNDLNACHEMEKVLEVDEIKWHAYTNALEVVCGTMHWRMLLHANASQRCEAFLKCLGLWQPNPAAHSVPVKNSQ